MPFSFEKTQIEDVILVKTRVFKDERGFFLETYKQSEFQENGINCEFIQDNSSYSCAKVLRGLHYQKGNAAQAKLVRCVSGSIYDVAVDIRPNSPTFKKYVRVELSSENGYALFIPRGFAHGFVVLSDFATITYKVDNEYSPFADAGIYWADEDLAIDWGVDFEPILSDKDVCLPRLKEASL